MHCRLSTVDRRTVGRWSDDGRWSDGGTDGGTDGLVEPSECAAQLCIIQRSERTKVGRRQGREGKKETPKIGASVFGACSERVEVECWRRGVCGVFGGKSSSSSSSSSSSGGFGAVAAECVVVFPEESACCVDEEVRARVGGGRCRCRSTQKRTKRRKLRAAQATQNLLSSFSSRRDFSRTGRSSAAGMGDGRDWWPFPA